MYKGIDKKEFIKYYIENKNSFIDETNRYFLLDLLSYEVRPILSFTYQDFRSCDIIIISNNVKIKSDRFKQIPLDDFFTEMCKDNFDIKRFVAIDIQTDEYVDPEVILVGENEDDIIILEGQKHDEIQF